MTKLELAAVRLYKAKLADKQRKTEMNKLVCEREVLKQDLPCWKNKYSDYEDEIEAYTEQWCKPCQDRQKLYLDKSVRKELGNAKRSFWAITRALLKGNQMTQQKLLEEALKRINSLSDKEFSAITAEIIAESSVTNHNNIQPLLLYLDNDTE